MSRRPNIIRPVRLRLNLPEDKRAMLELHLFSEVEGRVPVGAYQTFFLDRMRDYFNTVTLDLSPYSGDPPGTSLVRGAPHTIETLKRILNVDKS